MSGDPAGGLAGARILIVEDESLIAMLLEDTLRELQCEVVDVAATKDDALRKTAALQFDAAIVDVNLNGVRSFPVAQSLEARGIPYLFSTGYGDAAIPEQFDKVPVLSKPFGQADLVRVLTGVLTRVVKNAPKTL